jgi:hypothetical protein
VCASHALPFRPPRDEEEPYYLPPRILAAVRREAAPHNADGNWATYAQQTLDRELRACSLLLNDDQALMLHRYAAVLRMDPQELLAALLAPAAAHREWLWRRAKAFARAHAPRRLYSCLALAFWPATLVGLWTVAQWAASLLPLIIHR